MTEMGKARVRRTAALFRSAEMILVGICELCITAEDFDEGEYLDRQLTVEFVDTHSHVAILEAFHDC